jgi:predicted ABC-type ATPase
MLGGPNGSGKSTLLAYLTQLSRARQFPLGFTLNPDDIQRELSTNRKLYLGHWNIGATNEELQAFVSSHPLAPQLNAERPFVEAQSLIAPVSSDLGYFIPILSDFFRRRWLEARESFTFETVMSGADKLDLLDSARSRSYRTYLYFICTDSIVINRARIANRVKQGGHTVPDAKVASRYEGSLAQLVPAITRCSRSYLFDNSGLKHSMVGEFSDGTLIQMADNPPNWFVEHVLNRLF